MAYDLKNLNVSSLDFDDIKTSLISFLEQQSDLKDLDFRNEASSINLILNILATVTAYNGVYSQFGFTNSFATTATVLESLLGISSNSSTILAPTKSATTTRTVTVSGGTLSAYTTFNAKGTNGSDVFFFNVDEVSNNTSQTIKLYSGTDVISYTNYNYETNSCELPYTVNPDTISLYETVINTNVTTQWTKVDKSVKTKTGNNKHFTVLNGPNGYIVTTNLPTSTTITTTSKVLVKAITSNGGDGNSAVISAPSNVIFGSSDLPTSGYGLISVSRAKSTVLFNGTGQDRCVTINDYKNAILSSGISGTETESNISVANGSYPGQVKIYVTGLSTTGQSNLLDYLSTKTPAGITVVYQQ